MKKIFSLFFILCGFVYADIKVLETMEADFTQTIVAEDDSKIIYKGKMFAKSPSNVLWKYTEPIIKEVYIHSNEVVIYEPKLEQVIYSDLKENLDIFFLLKQAKKVKDELYSAKILNQNYNIVTKSSIVQKISFFDSLSNKVLIEFQNIKVNEHLDEKIFTFLPPAGVDLIHQ